MKPLRCLLALAALATMACGAAPKAKPRASLAKQADKQAKAQLSAYAGRCAKLAAAFKKDVATKAYLPATLHVREWSGAGAKVGETLSEGRFVGLLGKDGPRITLMMARGGLGKSRLSGALEAQACGAFAAVRVDLNWDVVQAKGGVAGLPAVVETRLAGKASADPVKGIEKALQGRALLLLLDSLDEVALDRRAEVVAAIERLMGPLQGSRAVVFTRPPVYSANYGFGRINARLVLPMLDCAGTQRALRELIGGDAQLAGFLEFTKRYGMDRMVVRSKGRCWYPHMATYRDILVLKRIAANIANAPPAPGSQLSSRARIYEFLLTVGVIKDLSSLKILPKDLLSLVDRMVAAQNPNGARRNLGFTLGGCLARSTMKEEGASKQLCERLMQSSLFKETSRPDTWQFRNQSLADLFLARQVHALMDAKGKAKCEVVSQRSALFESNEVAGFLVGMPHGQACLLPVIQELCAKSGDEATSVELLDQGLPPGASRAAALQSATAAAGDAATADACLGRTLRALAKTAPAAAKPVAAKKRPSKRRKRPNR